MKVGFHRARTRSRIARRRWASSMDSVHRRNSRLRQTAAANLVLIELDPREDERGEPWEPEEAGRA